MLHRLLGRIFAGGAYLLTERIKMGGTADIKESPITADVNHIEQCKCHFTIERAPADLVALQSIICAAWVMPTLDDAIKIRRLGLRL